MRLKRHLLCDGGDFNRRPLFVTLLPSDGRWVRTLHSPFLFSSLCFFFFPSLRVLFCVGWLADRGWSVTQPSRPSRTLWYLPPPPSSRRASPLIRQGYLGGPSPSKNPSTVTQKWTPPAVRGVKEDALKKDAGKLFNQIRSLYTMKCGVSAVHAPEPAEIGALLLIKYKLVFNRILFQEVCDYLAVDWPTVSAHFKAGNSRELCAALCWSSILFWDICFSCQHGFVFILSVFQTNRRCFFCAAFQELREVSNTVYWISTPSSFIHQNYIIFPHPSRIIAHF